MTTVDEMQKVQIDMLNELIVARNELVTKANAVTGNRDALVESIVEDENYPEIRALAVQVAELQERLDALVSTKVEEVMAGSTGDAETLTEQVKVLDAKIKPGVTFLKKLYPDLDTDEVLHKQDRLKGASRAGAGAGGRRVRGYNVVVTVGDEVTEFENFATAAKHLGFDTKDLQEQFFSKAGVEKIKDAPDTVEFEVHWTDSDEDGNETKGSAAIRAYRTGPSGPPTAAASDDSDDVDDDESDDDYEPTDEDLENLG